MSFFMGSSRERCSHIFASQAKGLLSYRGALFYATIWSWVMR